MAISAKAKPLINAKANTHSALTLEGMNFTDWKVTPKVPDNHSGEWKAAPSNKQPDLTRELRLVLKCKTSPAKVGPEKRDPPDGTLTITLTKSGSTDVTASVPVDYANDEPPAVP